MSGVTKHIYEHEIRDILQMWQKQIKSLLPLLPQYYKESDIIALLKHYYPHEWNSVKYKYSYYQQKDKYLKKRFGKIRYGMKKPERLLQSVSLYKKVTSFEYKKHYSDSFSEEDFLKAKEALWSKRRPRIERIDQKIEKALAKTQQITPAYLDQLIGFYERKNTSQKDRLYILLELKKYYSPKIIRFFFKINDTELNKQLRWEAFYHLQSFNYQPRARKQKYMQVHTRNKKRKIFLRDVYPNQTYHIPKNPYELEYCIENSKEQKIKEYDFFISHSSKDSFSVQKLIVYKNQQGNNVFCDWISDADYLKRNLMCDATLRVIEKRLLQSKALIFVESENSKNSVWCKYELNYFLQLDRPMFVIDKRCIENSEFIVAPLKTDWFVAPDYKNISLKLHA